MHWHLLGSGLREANDSRTLRTWTRLSTLMVGLSGLAIALKSKRYVDEKVIELLMTRSDLLPLIEKSTNYNKNVKIPICCFSEAKLGRARIAHESERAEIRAVLSEIFDCEHSNQMEEYPSCRLIMKSVTSQLMWPEVLFSEVDLQRNG